MLKNGPFHLFLILFSFVGLSASAATQGSDRGTEILFMTDEGFPSTETADQFRSNHPDIDAGINKTEAALLPLIKNTQLVLKVRIVEHHKNEQSKHKPFYVRYDFVNPSGSDRLIAVSKDAGAVTEINVDHARTAVTALAQ